MSAEQQLDAILDFIVKACVVLGVAALILTGVAVFLLLGAIAWLYPTVGVVSAALCTIAVLTRIVWEHNKRRNT